MIERTRNTATLTLFLAHILLTLWIVGSNKCAAHEQMNGNEEKNTVY